MGYDTHKKVWTHTFSNVNKFSKSTACLWCGALYEPEHYGEKCPKLDRKYNKRKKKK